MILRIYRTSDCGEIAKLFYDTVHSVNAADYTEEQLDAWANGKVDLEVWNRSFLEHHTVIAVEDRGDAEQIIGFGDMDSAGYLDRLYVHKDHQREGIASAICDELERTVKAETYVTHASITAKPFFLKRGYRVVKEQQVERCGILLTNFVMEKKICERYSDK
ncbi:MAG TPA: GNAT family N-acetyltransferase [Candidatus Mediterraneibacter norfolkensis]|nr:GNAT family N-acetyltransferase [Candidatus Mediterraneibacter norfolkensis]